MTWELYLIGAGAGLLFVILLAAAGRRKRLKAAKATADATPPADAAKETPKAAPAGATAPTAGAAPTATPAGGVTPAFNVHYATLPTAPLPAYPGPPPVYGAGYAPYGEGFYYEGPDRRRNPNGFAYAGPERRAARPDYIADAPPPDGGFAAGYAAAQADAVQKETARQLAAQTAELAAQREMINSILREARENRNGRTAPDLSSKSTAQLLHEVLRGYEQPQQSTPLAERVVERIVEKAPEKPERSIPHTPPPTMIAEVKVKNPDGTVEYTKTYQRYDGSKFTKSEIKDPQRRRIIARPAEPAMPGYVIGDEEKPSVSLKQKRRK
ncbi:hypothetical protein FACS1894211_12090 [Clostridia bacterium]|nr:hypothetical protein FACS1894211_12090 [Clostridia bacterium]